MKQNYSSELGFTLVELLTVVGIIGILAAIGVQSFVENKRAAFDGRAKEDLRNIIGAEEAYYSTNEAYRSCANATCPSLLPGIEAISDSITLQITATTSGFTGTATSSRGSGRIFRFDSSTGRIR